MYSTVYEKNPHALYSQYIRIKVIFKYLLETHVLFTYLVAWTVQYKSQRGHFPSGSAIKLFSSSFFQSIPTHLRIFTASFGTFGLMYSLRLWIFIFLEYEVLPFLVRSPPESAENKLIRL